MCGIVGIWDWAGSRDDAHLCSVAKAMSETIAHRGPDDSGVWANALHGIAFGFRRLSIQDLSSNGHQPMRSPSGRYVVMFNGEIYNAPALRAELAQTATTFRGHSDTEVLVAEIERVGFEAAVDRLSGMFAIACWDNRDAVLHLARDPLGKKPLYYGRVGRTFVFASELKALAALEGFAPALDLDSLATFFRFAYVPAPLSIYKGIHKLSAGERAIVTRDDTRTVRFWSVADRARRAATSAVAESDDDAIARLEALLGDAVERRLVSDVPIGAFLSGGIDSSVVVALMRRRGRVKTFAIGFEEARYDESGQAAAVAAHLGVEHHELKVTPRDLLDAVPTMPTVYDEPFADPSQVPTTLLARLARSHLTVALSGDGGDELFRGYGRYATLQKLVAGTGRIPAPLRSSVIGCLRLVPRGFWQAAERFVPGRFGTSPLASRVDRVAELIGSRAEPELIYRDLVGQWREADAMVVGGREQIAALWTGALRSAADDVEQRAQLIDLLTYLPDDILQKVDRASMSVGLEVRAPLLDPDVVDFALGLPAHQLVRDGKTKWLLRQVLYRHVPPTLVDRPKMGFGFPLAECLRGPLKDWADALVRSLAASGLVDPAPIEQKWLAHRTGRADWSYRLWCPLMFEAWRQANQGRTPRRPDAT